MTGLLDRYRAIFHKLYQEDRDLTIRRDSWGFGLGLIGTLALYGAYGWIALTTIAGSAARHANRIPAGHAGEMAQAGLAHHTCGAYDEYRLPRGCHGGQSKNNTLLRRTASVARIRRTARRRRLRAPPPVR